MNKHTYQLWQLPILFIITLIISTILAVTSLTVLMWFWGIVSVSLLAIVLHTALCTDKNRYAIRNDSPYYFTHQQALHVPITITKNGFVWPDGLANCDTILLRFTVKAGLLGWIRDPYLIISHQYKIDKHVLERGVKGVRLLNISSCRSLTPGDVIYISSRHMTWKTGMATLIGFNNLIDERKRLLIIAPHPDDAEIAAYGLYSQHDSTIVTLTAGLGSSKSYQHIVPDVKQMCYWRSKLRALDSVTVPRWGGLATTQCVNLGYPDGDLAKLANDKTSVLSDEQRTAMVAFRSYNTATWLPELPAIIGWQDMIDEIAHIIRTVKPTAIVCPHPIIDRHPDHRYATHMVVAALQQIRQTDMMLYCYQVHLATSRIAPFGPAHSAISLPPVSKLLPDYGKVYAQPLSVEMTLAKVFALEMMHDLRHPPAPSLPSWRQYHYALARIINRRQLSTYGDSDFYRRAIRPHELFFCYRLSALLTLLKTHNTELAWLSTVTHSAIPVNCNGVQSFIDLANYPGTVYRQVKNRQTKAITYNQQHYFVKLHHGVGLKEIFKNIVQSRLPVFGASNEWQAIFQCMQASILTTPLVCYGKWGYLHKQRSFIMTRALTQTCTLEDVGDIWKETLPSFNLKRQIIHKLADVVRQFHQQGMNHRDCYVCHFLIPDSVLSTNSVIDNLPMYIIDLHRVQIRHKVPTRYLIKDLSALLFSVLDYGLTQHDYFYFIKHYLQTDLTIALANQSFWQKVVKRAKKLYCQENREKC